MIKKNLESSVFEGQTTEETMRSFRRGNTTLGVVVAILAILGILGFSLNRSLGEKLNTVHSHTLSCLLDLAAVEISEVVFHSLERKGITTSDSLFLQILGAKPNDFPLSLPTSWIPKTFSFSPKKEYSNFSYRIHLDCIDAEPILASGSWNDPQEKLFKIRLNAELSLGESRFKKMTKKYTLTRYAKCQNLKLPVISKFTLFVKDPEETSEKKQGYNCLRNSITGKPLPAARGEPDSPLILFNSSSLKEDNLRKTGHVFLGGNRNIELHLTAGGDSYFGEYFQFFNMGKPESKPPVLTLSPLPQTSAFSSGIDFSDESGIKHTFIPIIRGVFGGFYLQDEKSPPGDMDSRGALGAYFSSSASRPKSSSFLHLYGNLDRPSPTVVIGRVKRVYSFFTRMFLKSGQENVKFGPWLCAPAKNSGGFWETLSNPQGFVHGEKFYELDPPITHREIFSSQTAYESMASRLIMEDYNYAFDWLIDSTGRTPPPEVFREHGGGEYIQTGKAVEFHLSNRTESCVIDVTSINTRDLIENRISYVVENQAELESIFIKQPGILSLRGKTVFVRTGPVELPRGISYDSSGILVVNGDIKIVGGITCQSSKEHILTIVSRSGNLELTGTNEEIRAYLVALDGSIKCTSKARVKIHGGVAVKNLIPSDIPGGGTITFDENFDPTSSNGACHYSIQIADFNETWNVVMQ